MEFKTVLTNRRAVRDFKDTPVDVSLIGRLIGGAVLAPSAADQQPWAFAVLTSRTRIDSCAEHAAQWLLTHPEEHGLGKSGNAILEKPGFSMFYHAPAVIIVMARSPAQQAAEDCCLAAENLMLAARDEGLGTCWIGFARPWLNLPDVKAELGLPEGYSIVAPISIGYPVAWPETHGRKTPEIHWV